MFEKIRIHHIFGIILSILLAFTLAVFPVLLEWQGSLAPSPTLTIFFVFVLAFLMNNAILKNYEIRRSINVELSRLRRVHHLAEKIGTSAKDKKFRDRVEAGIEKYLDYLNRNGLSQYSEARSAFREVTYAVYEYKPVSNRDMEFLKEMLTTTRELALTRQKMVSLLARHISSYGWTIMIVIETMVIGSILVTQAPGLVDYLVSSATIATVFIITMMIYEVDTNSEEELEELGKKYGDNIKGLTHEKKK